MEIEKHFAKMSTETIEGSSIWTDDEVLLLIGIWVDEQILQQLDICSKRPIYDKMAELWLHPYIFVGKTVEDNNILPVRKRKTSKLFCIVNATGSPRVRLAPVCVVKTGLTILLLFPYKSLTPSLFITCTPIGPSTTIKLFAQIWAQLLHSTQHTLLLVSFAERRWIRPFQNALPF